MIAVADTTPPAPAKKKRPSECHSCHEPVVWVVLDKKRVPLDFLEEGGGNIALELDLLPPVPGETHLQRAMFVSGVSTHYRRHIDSCKDAEQWRAGWKRTASAPFSRIDRKKKDR